MCRAIVESSELIRLDNLQKVGENFCNLIYGSLDSIGFNEFNIICKSVLNKLHRVQKLTDSLVCSYICNFMCI